MAILEGSKALHKAGRERLDETLTITLGLADRLRRSLGTTNAAESLISPSLSPPSGRLIIISDSGP